MKPPPISEPTTANAPDRRAQIEALRAAGNTFKQIGIELGMTRSAVAGQVSRIGKAKAKVAAAAAPAAKRRPGCRFPLWDDRERPNHRYCGKALDRGSYCKPHADRCYRGLWRAAA